MKKKKPAQTETLPESPAEPTPRTIHILNRASGYTHALCGVWLVESTDGSVFAESYERANCHECRARLVLP